VGRISETAMSGSRLKVRNQMIRQRVQMNASTRILFAALLIVAVGLSACGQSTSEPV